MIRFGPNRIGSDRHVSSRPLISRINIRCDSPRPARVAEGCVMALPRQKSFTRGPRGLMDRVVRRPIGALKEFPDNPTRHPESQIARLMKSIRRFWTNPILIDETGTILAGHGRWEAARRLGMTEVPTVTVSGLSDAEKRTVVIADNRLPEQAVWDFDLLRGHFQDLIKLDFDVELTGFSIGEVDLLIDGSQQPPAADPADDLVGLGPEGPAVSQFGDVWKLGRHRLVCGDAQRGETCARLLRGELAEMELSTIASWIGATFLNCSAPHCPFIRNGKIFWSGTRPPPARVVSIVQNTNSSRSSKAGPGRTSIISSSVAKVAIERTCWITPA